MAKKKKKQSNQKRAKIAPVSNKVSEGKSKLKKLPNWKIILFSLLPVVLILLGAEVIIRLAGLAEPILQTKPLPEESAGLFRADPELFWSLQPNLNVTFEGVQIITNDRGLRAAPLSPKKDNEYRILSLGESSTFGIGVSGEQTYTALLPKLLQARDSARTFTSINAGVSAWSSFQSLKFLENQGLELKPDLLLFYHEMNDYLPSTLRDASNTEIGVLKTDRQLYDSRLQSFSRTLSNVSALFRFLKSRIVYRSIKKFNSQDVDNPLLEIGMPDIGITGRLNEIKNGEAKPAYFNEKTFGRRVSENERQQNLSELKEICKANNIKLIVIHPSYRPTKRHECLLTRFCKEQGVLMFEAQNVLHPNGIDPTALYRDSAHPNAEGHRRVATGLAAFIANKVL